LVECLRGGGRTARVLPIKRPREEKRKSASVPKTRPPEKCCRSFRKPICCVITDSKNHLLGWEKERDVQQQEWTGGKGRGKNKSCSTGRLGGKVKLVGRVLVPSKDGQGRTEPTRKACRGSAIPR